MLVSNQNVNQIGVKGRYNNMIGQSHNELHKNFRSPQNQRNIADPNNRNNIFQINNQNKTATKAEVNSNSFKGFDNN